MAVPWRQKSLQTYRVLRDKSLMVLLEDLIWFLSLSLALS